MYYFVFEKLDSVVHNFKSKHCQKIHRTGARSQKICVLSYHNKETTVETTGKLGIKVIYMFKIHIISSNGSRLKYKSIHFRQNYAQVGIKSISTEANERV